VRKRRGSQIEKSSSTYNEEYIQFRNTSYGEVKQYILKTKGVEIGSDFN